MDVIWFLFGVFIGGLVGFGMCALLIAGKNNE